MTPALALFLSPTVDSHLSQAHWQAPAAMDLLFGRRKTPEELLRQNQRALNRAMRELDRERQKLETQEKKIIADIKKMAKQGQMVSSAGCGLGRRSRCCLVRHLCAANGTNRTLTNRCFEENGLKGKQSFPSLGVQKGYLQEVGIRANP